MRIAEGGALDRALQLVALVIMTITLGIAFSGPFVMLFEGVTPFWAVATVVSFLMISVPFLITARSDRRRAQRILREAAEDPAVRLQRRIEAVNQAFAEAEPLLKELQVDLQRQEAVRRHLAAQVEQQQRVIAMDRGQADAVRAYLLEEAKAALRGERRQQWMFFAVGVLVSIPIGILVNIISPN